MNRATMQELFGGAQRYKVLKQLYEHPAEQFHTRALATLTNISPGTLHTLLRRLTRVGLAQRIERKPLVYYQAATGDIRLKSLTEFFRQDSQLVLDIRKALAPFRKVILYAGIFGSFARETERGESDVDVLVVGPGNGLKVQAALAPVARRYSREINASAYTEERFSKMAADRDTFFEEVGMEKRIDLMGSWHAAAHR